jgi:hypothetical protein
MQVHPGKYVRPKCLNEELPLVEATTPGHLYRCWYPVGSVEVTVDLARNGHTIDRDPVPAEVN